MRIIIIMLVFEPELITLPWNLWSFPTTLPRVAPTLHDCTFIWFLLFSIITLSPVSFAYPTPRPVAPPSTGNCYNEQRNNRLNPCWFHALFREAQPRYNSLTEWFTKSIQLKNIPVLVTFERSLSAEIVCRFPRFFIYIYLLLSSSLVYFESVLSRPSVRIIGIYFSLVA